MSGEQGEREALRDEVAKLRGWVNDVEQKAGALQRKLNAAEAEVERLRAAPVPAAQSEPVYIRVDDLQKARRAPHLCRVGPEMRSDFVAIYTATPAEFEVRDDGKHVRVDRWEVGIRRIVALLWGNRRTFEIDEVVETVRALVSAPKDDDEALLRSVLAAPASVAQSLIGWWRTTPAPVALTPAQQHADELESVLRALHRAGGIWPDLHPRVCEVLEKVEGAREAGGTQ